jgi:hypothetical protein
MAPVHGLEQLQPVHAAHAQVGDQQLRQLMVQHASAASPLARLDGHVVALGVQAHRQQPQQGGIVVDDQDACHGCPSKSAQTANGSSGRAVVVVFFISITPAVHAA